MIFLYTDKLINLLFKDQIHDRSYYEALYKERNTTPILRFAPSPTGYLHTGSLYTALINYMLALKDNGIFYLRIEDTDTKRTVADAYETLTSDLAYFGITYENDEAYGPYFQSKRKDIYHALVIDLLKQGKAYPCFLTETEIEEIKKYQEENKLRTGIYSSFAKYRDIDEAAAIDLISKGRSYVIRLKSSGDFNKTFKIKDVLRGELELHENDFDLVLLKQDGLPTYHFAHAVDDYLMHTTMVVRGEEWLTSLPIHVELFKTLDYKVPKYLHLDSIMKLDNGSKRKLSKRHDPEAKVSYLIEDGYPKEGITNYLLTLANSNYEEYLKSSASNNYKEFKLDIKKMSKTGALFDIDKLNYISKESISYMSREELFTSIKNWASLYQKELLNLIQTDENKFKAILNIGSNGASKRKDFAKYSEVLELIKPFYNEYFDKMPLILDYGETLISAVKEVFITTSLENEEVWLNTLKEKAFSLGFAKNKKEALALNMPYQFADFMKIIRNLLFRRDNSPSLYEVMTILGIDEVKRRLGV